MTEFNVNSRFLNEARELEKYWADKDLFEGLTIEQRQMTAKLMECERLRNEISTDPDDVKTFHGKNKKKEKSE